MLPIRIKACSESDLRMLGNLARNIQRVLPVTQADIDAAAALGKGWVVWKVIEVNDPIDNLRGGTQLVIKQNSITPGQNVRRVLIVSGPGGEIVVVGPGPSPLLLPDAIADSLTYVKAFGGTEQRDIPDNYLQRQFIYMMDGSYLLTDIVPTYDGRIEMDFQTTTVPSGSVYLLGGRTETYGGLFFAKGGSGTVLVDSFGDTSADRYTSSVSLSNNTRYKFTFNNKVATLESGGTTLFTNTSTGEKANGAALCINGLNSSGTISGAQTGIYLYSFKVWNGQGELIANYVPAVEKAAVPVVGFYDTVSKTFKTATAGIFAAGGEAVPTPGAPMNIVSNNGVLKFTANEANYTVDNVTLGYWLRNNNGQPEQSPANFYTAMMPVKPNTSYVCFGRTKDTNTISGYNRIAWYDAGGVWIRNSTYTANTPGIDTSPANAAFARFHCNPNGTEVTQDLVDSYNWVFQVGTAEVPYTPYSPTKVYTAGPIETIAIKDDQDTTVSTATCEDLLAFDATRIDEQEVISGVITRKVGVIVFDGTETWTKASGYTNIFYTNAATDAYYNDSSAERIPLICSHLTGTDATNTNMQDNTIKLTAQGAALTTPLIYIKASVSGDNLTTWQNWLAAQYAAGTPVIVVYPLKTATTESVTGQPMNTAAGDNTAEITQAGMAGLELEVTYMKGA